MSLAQADRIALSLKIVSADTEVAGLDAAKASLTTQQTVVQNLDSANKNLFDPTNLLVNAYQSELASLDGQVRSVTVEQDIQDSAAKKIQNHFFPNDTTISVPSLSPFRNVWPRVQPFALSYAIGKNYTQVFPGTTTKEPDLISTTLSLISSASANLDIENTSGQHVTTGAGTCSLPEFTTQSTCEAATPTPGVWTPGIPAIVSYPAVITLKSNLVSAVNTLIIFLNSELALIPTDPANQSQNNAAKNDISNIILPALNAWLANPDFQPVPGSVTPATFNSYDSSLLAPTKLHSTQINALQSALTARQTFVATRTNQLSTVLGTIDQNVDTGALNSSSGLYGKRYGFLLLRLNALGGSLTQLTGLQTATGAQDSIKANTIATKATYQSILPTSMLKANASGSTIIHLVDPSFVSQGDTVYVYAENQDELQRGVASVQGDMITLNDIIPAKYVTASKARLYKDLT